MESNTESAVYEFDRFRVDAGKRLLWNGNEPVPLTPKVFDTLFHLVRNAGKTVSKDELMAMIWPDTVVEENSLNKNISVLRQLLGEKPGEHRFIATVPGKGYRFVALVSDQPGNPSQFPVPVHSAFNTSISIAVTDPTGNTRRLGLRSLRFLAFAVTLILLAAALYSWKRGPQKSEPIRSIAVLPFRPIAKELRNEALELGMADSLITQLGKSSALVVRPLSETGRFLGSERDPAEIGRSIGVDAILEGSMQASEGRIRVTTRLIRSADGKQMWAANFDEQMRDVFAVQDSITERVATVLDMNLGGRSRKRYTDNVESYQFFILGRYTALKLTPQDHAKAIEYFRKAIEKDPKYALAYAGITSTYVAYMLASDAAPADTMPEAKAAALKAVELDDELPEAHVALGKVAMFYEWNWTEAERHLVRAYDLDPNDTEGQLFLAHLYSNTGRHDKAIELAKTARRLDPLTINRGANVGQFLYHAGRYDEAIETLNQAIELNPTHWLPRMFIARVYLEKGMFHEAITSCEKARQLGSPSLELIALEGWAYARLGDASKARAQLKILEDTSTHRYVPPYFLAIVHNALGETDLALSLLEKGLAARDVRMVFLKVDPKWNNLRKEPRFTSLMKQMRFE